MSASPAPAVAQQLSSSTERSLRPVNDDADQTSRRKVSALVTTFNEAENVEECLRSLAWCDEIVVVDSFSSDSTLDIIGRFPDVKVLQRTYYGAASQKNWAIDRLSHDWVLILDADERVTPELRTEIEGILGSPSPAGAYSVKRRVFALGKQIRFSGWQNDSVVRLFRRDAARYPNRRVHADMMTRERPKCLEEYLDHHMVSDLAEYFKRIQRYSWWGAAQLWRGRRRAGFSDIVLRPAWRFLRTYVLQLGFMEGQRGIVMCGLQSYGAFLKYAILWSWQIQAKRGKVPRLPEFDDDSSTWAWHKNDSSSSVFWPNTEVRVETTQQP